MSQTGQGDEPPKRFLRLLLAVLAGLLLFVGTAFAATDTPTPDTVKGELDVEKYLSPSPAAATEVVVSKSTATLREEALEEAKRQEQARISVQKATQSRTAAPAPKKVLSADREANKAVVRDVMLRFFDSSQWPALEWLILQESGFNNHAQNPSSTAYGMFQFLNGTWKGYGVEKTSDPEQQAIAGMRYIQARYQTPAGAKAFHLRHGWY